MVANCMQAITASLSVFSYSSEEWKMLMSHFTQCVILQRPEFTAANFYDVNFGAIFTIFNMMTGYIVVVVQFSKDSCS